eukprot:scaffold20246_cov58-Phaeocystis_antarctica.AAC.10
MKIHSDSPRCAKVTAVVTDTVVAREQRPARSMCARTGQRAGGLGRRSHTLRFRGDSRTCSTRCNAINRETGPFGVASSYPRGVAVTKVHVAILKASCRSGLQIYHRVSLPSK